MRVPGSRLCRFLLRLLGWQVVFVAPPSPKTVIIGYPHTSNWDFPVTMLWRFATGFPMQWVAKKEMFENPLGSLFQRWGGIPLDRSKPDGFIEQVCAEFARRESFHLAIAPEGTRKRTDHWKTGFHRIAVAAGVPLGLAFLDYGRKQLGIAEWIVLSGDREADLERIRAYYADKRGYRPERAGDIRFKD
ncbi:MAG: 1-acyl-sn-glycerol-3-phosphate acyltransferase [Rhodocyclaceae bacterium]|nr:1-acyl-sn-glycerol-3-phosphate acyltransferase [Rhodocyclaceae bacterium]